MASRTRSARVKTVLAPAPLALRVVVAGYTSAAAHRLVAAAFGGDDNDAAACPLLGACGCVGVCARVIACRHRATPIELAVLIVPDRADLCPPLDLLLGGADAFVLVYDNERSASIDAMARRWSPLVALRVPPVRVLVAIDERERGDRVTARLEAEHIATTWRVDAHYRVAPRSCAASARRLFARICARVLERRLSTRAGVYVCDDAK